MNEIARVRPWLGTLVSIRARGASDARLIEAIEEAFSEIAVIHRRMSFHDADSDLSRLHRAEGCAVAVDARTHEVIAHAMRIAEESDGVFDPTVAAELVADDALPMPIGAMRADAAATWRDIEVLEAPFIRLRRRVWIDLGGIAKGYAADRALDVLRRRGLSAATVNAGGDIARFGESSETIAIDPGFSNGATAALDVGDAAVATSSTVASRRAHWHGRRRRPVVERRSVTVVAGTCCVADALTKVMLADVETGRAMLSRHDATAWIFERDAWREIAHA